MNSWPGDAFTIIPIISVVFVQNVKFQVRIDIRIYLFETCNKKIRISRVIIVWIRNRVKSRCRGDSRRRPCSAPNQAQMNSNWMVFY